MSELAKIQKGLLSHLNQSANAYAYKNKLHSVSAAQLLYHQHNSKKHNFKRDSLISNCSTPTHESTSPVPKPAKENIKLLQLSRNHTPPKSSIVQQYFASIEQETANKEELIERAN